MSDLNNNIQTTSNPQDKKVIRVNANGETFINNQFKGNLTGTEQKILRAIGLSTNGIKTVELYNHIYDGDEVLNNVSVMIHRIRMKLGKDCFHNSRSTGYSLGDGYELVFGKGVVNVLIETETYKSAINTAQLLSTDLDTFLSEALTAGVKKKYEDYIQGRI